MTRRKFISKLIKRGSLILGAACLLAKKAVPRRFVRAVSAGKYPGRLKPLASVRKRGKWSG